MRRPTDNEIRAFWNWFLSVADNFGDHFDNQELIQELDQKISKMGDFSWELGPGVADQTNSALVITPCGDKTLLPVTKLVVANAPKIPGWEFFASKPPKKWERRFLVEAENGRKIEIDASNWKYALLKFPEGTFDIIIKSPELIGLTKDLQYTAATIVLDSEIGEEMRLQWIVGVDVVAEFDEELSKKNNPIEVFAEHFNSLKKSKQEQ